MRKAENNRKVEKASTGVLKQVSIDLGYLLIAVLLNGLAFPNFIFAAGINFLAFFALVPVFLVIRRTDWVRIFFYGAFYGLVNYIVMNFWLVSWHPLAIFFVPAIYSGYMFLLFPILKLIALIFPRSGYLWQTAVWIGYEYLRTLGFLGYCYGIMGYSQFAFIPLIQIAAFTGVFGVSFLVVFPSAFLAGLGQRGFQFKIIREELGRHLFPAALYITLFLTTLLYGYLNLKDYSWDQQWKVALIQQNIDPWKGGIEAYERALEINTRLSEQALRQEPETQTVIWSETSFVPGITYYLRYMDEPIRWNLVNRLIAFMDRKEVSFVIGNNDETKQLLSSGEKIRVDRNAAILYFGGKIQQVYKKLKLVPFSENFPYRNALLWLHHLLQSADIHYYEKGSEYVIFKANGISFATPICFEDSFGELNRQFVKRGADVLVNLSNDSWAFSVVSMRQHMAMAVFRAVENRRSLVRCTNGGLSCTVDPNGRIRRQIEPMKEGFLIDSIPVERGPHTLYTRFGDCFALAALVAVFVALAVGFILRFFKHR